MYPHQSRCDVTTLQQIGTLSRSACDFSPEFSQRFERFETSRVVSVVSCFQGFLIFAKSLQEKQTKVGEFLQQTCHPPGFEPLWQRVAKNSDFNFKVGSLDRI